MKLFKQNSKVEKRFSELLNKISEEMNIDRSVIIHFINNELEKIYNDKIITNNIRLVRLEDEIKSKLKSEQELKHKISEKETLLKNTTERIDNFSLDIKTKTALLENKKNELSEFKAKLNDIDFKLKEIEKKKKTINYDIMMKSHSIKEVNDITYKYLKVFLAITTLIAIIIVTILIYKK